MIFYSVSSYSGLTDAMVGSTHSSGNFCNYIQDLLPTMPAGCSASCVVIVIGDSNN